MATARLEAEQNVPLNVQEYLGFGVGKELFAVPIIDVSEVVKPLPFTPVPNVQEYVEGIMNLRGKIIPLIDLSKRLLLGKKTISNETRIVIAERDNKLVGMVVDHVIGVLSVDMEAIEDAPEVVKAKIAGEFITGVTQLERQLFILLDIQILLKS